MARMTPGVYDLRNDLQVTPPHLRLAVSGDANANEPGTCPARLFSPQRFTS